MTEQHKQSDWHYQWANFYDSSFFLFQEWIYPNRLDIFSDKEALDCGCGGGQHVNLVASLAKEVVGVDLNTADIACNNNLRHSNVSFFEGDLASIDLKRQFDVVYCLGVIHHTVNPNTTFQNLKRFVKPGGRLIIWCYSQEGNWLNEFVLEPLKRLFILKLPKMAIRFLAVSLTAMLYPIIYTVYFLPLKFLPYYEYFDNFRKLSFQRNELNIFDKLNAPLTHFITESQVNSWFNNQEFIDVFIDHYKMVSWRASGTKLP